MVAEPVRIVVLSDDPAVGDAVRREAAAGEVVLAPDLASARRALGAGPAVLVLADDERVAAVAGVLDEAVPGTPIVLLDPEPARAELLVAVESGRIAEVVALPWPVGALRAALARARRLAGLAAELRRQSRAHEDGGRLHRMIDAMADGLLLADLASDSVTINVAARHMLGIPPDQRVTRQYLKDRHGFYPFDLVVASRPAGGAPPVPLREELHVKGQVLHSIVTPVLDDDDELVGVVVVLRDITDAKEAAHRQQEFVSLVSHELRTPLTSITGALDLVITQYAAGLTEKQQRYIEMARDSCGKLNTIVDDLLDVA
ncbi:MAG TPA: histidine kinase dimerization/phospho-acceptor domain-containing protein, partial [Kofleriaceae bacterium]|nr:histidine kinase dimerization/phospho-acceptor domain-containing protein [Kofleriaceae bacterium]